MLAVAAALPALRRQPSENAGGRFGRPTGNRKQQKGICHGDLYRPGMKNDTAAKRAKKR
jgi:hypothetical protein